jgi:glycosidase
MRRGESKTMNHVEWARNANIYEVNLRQYTPQGTFAAFQDHLPRLKRMGVKILWLMPIQPIGARNRKGTLGSYYSVRDYVAVNPEFGTLDDFKRLVKATHDAGMHVIIDWVANHSAWDHAWVAEHPRWYKKNDQGEIHSYAYDNGREIEYWTDVVGLDYAQPALWPAMTDAMKFWVRETGIDGYRCDVASLVPTPFWEQTRAALEQIKPVFMLAESAAPELHRRAFDMTYDWSLYDALTEIAGGHADADQLAVYLDDASHRYPGDAYRMTFTTNHDKNAWEGNDAERFGEAAFKVFAVLAATLPGMPLIYGGQESWLDKRVAFFEKDAIEWKDHRLGEFYAGLLRLKTETSALWNGADGGAAEVLATGNKAVFAFTRSDANDAVTVVANLSNAQQLVHVAGAGNTQRLAPWSYTIDRKGRASP